MALRLFLLQPTAIFAARVNMPSGIAYPLDSITFDTVTTGAYTDIKVGQTVLLGSAAGLDDLGRQRVRKTPTSTILYVGRSSQGIHDGELSVADNMYITVLNDFRVWAKIPFFDDDGEVFKDSDIAFVDQTDLPPPVANCGPGTCATTSAGIITVQFVGTNSFAVAPGASISTYLWAVADGTITVGTSASSTITATFPAGFRWVSLTVTDSNGATHIARCPVYARNSASDTTIPNWQIESHRITPAGQEISVKVLSSIPVTTYPDGTLAMIADGEPASASDRTHMLFIGWHHTDPAQIAAQRTGTLKDTTLNLLDVAGKLATLPALSQTITNLDDDGNVLVAATKWSQMLAPNKDKFLHYLFHWHSTALELADWTWTGTTTTYPFVVRSLYADSLWGQISREAKTIVPNYILTCNTLGQIFTKVDPMLLDTGSRTATIQATLAGADFTNIRYTHQRPGRYHWLRANAILASLTAITPVFSISPGEAPAQGESAAEQGEQLAVSQAALNTQEGHRYARLNAPESHFSITLAAGSDQGIEPANLTWVRLTISSALAAQRGLSFTTARGLVHSIDIRYEHARTGLVRSVELEWEREVTSGLAAVTEEQADDQLPEPEFDPPPNIYDPTPPPTTPTGLGFGTVYVRDEHGLYRTRDFSVASPTWAAIDPTIGGSEDFEDFILDPWDPEHYGYLATSEGLYMSDDLDQATPTWTKMVDDATDVNGATGTTINRLFDHKLLGTPNIEGFIAWFFPAASGTEVWMCRTTDRFTTFDFVKVLDGGASPDGTAGGSVDVVPHLIGGELVFYIATKLSDKLYKSSDSGDTWSIVGSFPDNISEPRVVHCPYEGNEDGSIVYVGFATDGSTSPVGRVYRSTDGGVTFMTISPIASRGVTAHRTGVESSTLDHLSLYCWAEQVSALGDANDRQKLYVSSDGGANWTYTGYQVVGTGVTMMGSSGFPYDSGQFYVVVTNDVLVSTNGGTSFTSKKGDIFTAVGAANFDTTSGGSIVPLWTS